MSATLPRREHKGLSDDLLAARGIRVASTFFDEATAERALAGVQATNQSAIEAWLATAKVGAKQPFRASFDSPIGRILYRDRQLIVDGYSAVAILRVDPNSPIGYFIHTGYVER